MFYLLMRDIEDRDGFIAHMRSQEIYTPFHYVPLHDSPAGLQKGRASGTMNVTRETSARLVRLPMFLSLGDKIDTVIAAALDFMQPTNARALAPSMPVTKLAAGTPGR